MPYSLGMNVNAPHRALKPHPDYQPVRVWSIESGEILFTLKGFVTWPYVALISPDGKQIATLTRGMVKAAHIRDPNKKTWSHGTFGGKDTGARVDIWDADTGQHLRTLHQSEGMQYQTKIMLWHPTKNRLLFDCEFKDYRHETRIVDTYTGKLLTKLAPFSPIRAKYGPKGRLIVGLQSEQHPGNDVNVWQADSGKLIWKFNHEKDRIATTFGVNHDESGVLVTYQQGNGHLFSMDTGQPLYELVGHAQQINSAEFSRDGYWLTTASDDGTVRVWDAADGTEWMSIDLGVEVASSKFTPDSRQILVITKTGEAQLLPVDPLPLAMDRKPRQLFEEERKRFQIDQPLNVR